jgi:hypothetical protein
MHRKSKINRKYNLRPDRRDDRDFRWQVPEHVRVATLPESADLVPLMPPVYDQKGYGTCASNAVAGVLHYLMVHGKVCTPFAPSRLFLAWNADAIEGSVKESDGVYSIRDVVSPTTSLGFVCETLWTYDEMHLDVKPTSEVFAEAEKHTTTSYQRVQDNDLPSIKAALAMGHPVACGIQVYGQLESAQCAVDGVVATPGWWGRLTTCLGGHAIVLVGYDDKTQKFTFRNSWGLGWAQAGYGTLGYDYIANSSLASDFWVVDGVMEVHT